MRRQRRGSYYCLSLNASLTSATMSYDYYSTGNCSKSCESLTSVTMNYGCCSNANLIVTRNCDSSLNGYLNYVSLMRPTNSKNSASI